VSWVPHFKSFDIYRLRFRWSLWFFYMSFRIIFHRLNLVVIGADCLDSNRPDRLLLLLQYLLGGKIFVFGASYRKNPGFLSRIVFRIIGSEKICLCSRDPESRRRLENVSGKKVHQVGDLAFLLQASVCTDPKINSFVSGGGSKKLIAVFPAVRGVFDFGHTLKQYLKVLNELQDEYRILVINHAGDKQTEMLCEAIYKGIEGEKLLIQDVDINEMRSYLASASFALSSLMHASVACLCLGIPPILVEYADKATGIFNEFECAEMLLNDPSGFPAKVAWLKANEAELRARISKNLPKMKEMSQLNFSYFNQFFSRELGKL